MQKGFTLVELLVAMIMVVALATLVLVSYNGLQNRAYDTSVRSDFDSMLGEIESFRTQDYIDNRYGYPSSIANLNSISLYVSKGNYDQSIEKNMYYCINTTDYQSFRLIAKSKSGNIIVLNEDGLMANHTVQDNDLDDTLCSSEFGMTLVSTGMSSPGVWESWAKSG